MRVGESGQLSTYLSGLSGIKEAAKAVLSPGSNPISYANDTEENNITQKDNETNLIIKPPYSCSSNSGSVKTLFLKCTL